MLTYLSIKILFNVIWAFCSCRYLQTKSTITIAGEEGLTSKTVISKTVISNLENGYLEFNLETRFWVTL
jgi:hypothetical protein